jgi:hypothetical protein
MHALLSTEKNASSPLKPRGFDASPADRQGLPFSLPLGFLGRTAGRICIILYSPNNQNLRGVTHILADISLTHPLTGNAGDRERWGTYQEKGLCQRAAPVPCTPCSLQKRGRALRRRRVPAETRSRLPRLSAGSSEERWQASHFYPALHSTSHTAGYERIFGPKWAESRLSYP